MRAGKLFVFLAIVFPKYFPTVSRMCRVRDKHVNRGVVHIGRGRWKDMAGLEETVGGGNKGETYSNS